jgi:hypothetical protein
VDTSETLWDTTIRGHVELGAAGIVEADGRTLILATDSQGLAWWTLNGEENGERGRDTELERDGKFLADDLDGDGVTDLVVFHTLVEVGWSFGTHDETWTTVLEPSDSCFQAELTTLDADGDGDPDLLLPKGVDCTDMEYRPMVLVNEGDRTWSEPVEIDGDPGHWGDTFDLTVFDFDGDGSPDTYVCNDNGPIIAPNTVYLNDGNGALYVGDALGADVTSYCMGSSVGDLDGDLDLDLYVAGSNNEFALIQGIAGFSDGAASYGWEATSFPEMPWGSAIVDVNNDGYEDLLTTTSDFSFMSDHESYPIRLRMRDAGGDWKEKGEQFDIPQQTSSRGLVVRDLNDDGIVDLLAADFERNPWLLLSDGCTEENWVEVTAPPGTVVRIETENQSWIAPALHHGGYGATHPPTAHLGLGGVDTIDRIVLEVPWVGEVVLDGPIEARRRLAWSP